MSGTKAAWRRFDWRLLLAARAVIIVAAVVATIATLAVWRAPFGAPQIYAFADIVLSCIAVSRLRSAGWIFVAVHLIVAAAWCEAIWHLPARWFE
ncbi:hypothetical protein LJR164_001464 [Phenylobacterium sp. LjRoot164]|uniref:hypothetical protein n=1 Tax=unclassified Phenylobacterium TaxID=2640670 RepID=UPI003ECC6501